MVCPPPPAWKTTASRPLRYGTQCGLTPRRYLPPAGLALFEFVYKITKRNWNGKEIVKFLLNICDKHFTAKVLWIGKLLLYLWTNHDKVIVNIKDGIVKGEMPGRTLRMILEWLEDHRKELMANWEKAQKDEHEPSVAWVRLQTLITERFVWRLDYSDSINGK